VRFFDRGFWWRWGRDSNPRYHYWYSSFQDCPIKPLSHPTRKKAERVGFEPTRGYYSPSTLAVCRFKPLSHLSNY
jgi:hypothetical protein